MYLIRTYIQNMLKNNFLQLSNEKINNSILKWTKGLNRQMKFNEEDLHTASNYIKKSSASLVTREFKIKAIMR